MRRLMPSARLIIDALLAASLMLVLAVSGAEALSTAFTYQGQLNQSGLPSNGTCDFQFGLFGASSGGTALGTQTVSGANVTNGLFTVQLNDSAQLGATAFNGSDRWLEIAVRCPAGGGGYTTLIPRQQLTAAPYSLYAPTAGSASGLSCTGCVSSSALGVGAVTASSIANGTILQSNLAFTPVLSVGASAPLASSGGQNPSISLTGVVPLNKGGTGTAATVAADARTALGAAASGANSDITRLSGITDSPSTNNTAAGAQALQNNSGGTLNTAFGGDALKNNQSGTANTGIGAGALRANTAGGNNTAVGQAALTSNVDGVQNVAVGDSANKASQHASANVAVGSQALRDATVGANTAVGAYALQYDTTGDSNTAVGYSALIGTSGYNNTAVGRDALRNVAAGNDNIGVGRDAGINLDTGSNNIDIDNVGVAGESNTTRIGTTQTQVFIAGISGATVTGGVPVVVSATGQLGTATGGVAATPRFVDNGDGTVTDTKTGLMWEKKTDEGGLIQGVHDKNNTYTWSTGTNNPDGTAFTVFLAKLNDVAGGGAHCFAGYCDWRLPNEDGRNSPFTGPKELETLLDYTQGACGGGTGPCTYPALNPTMVDYAYWSATTYAGGPAAVWAVYFLHGDVENAGKTYTGHVRAVRGGL